MKTLKNIKRLLAASLLVFTLHGCDFLNVSDQLASELSMEEVFNNSSYTRRFQRGVYTGIPDMSYIMLNESYGNVDGLGNPWPGACDELKMAATYLKDLQTTGYHAGNANMTRWSLYQIIRQANLFLRDAHTIASDKDPLDEAELNSLKAETRFLRAYYHYLLFELYGAIPIVTEAADPSSTNIDFARNSLDEVVGFLDTEFKEVANQLNEVEPEDRRAIPTKAVALAIRAKMWVYAASPLYNGGYPEAVALKNADGKQLFPAKDPAKWQKAVSALQDFLTYAEGRFSLCKLDKAGKAVEPGAAFDVDASLYGLFQNHNSEILWASTKDSWGTVDYEGTQRRCTPRSEGGNGGMSSVGVTQELIDAFFMEDGLNINESPLYHDDGFSNVTQKVSVFGKEETVTDNIFNMYLKREPRFYQAVTYSGKRWHVSGNPIFFYKGSKDDNTSSNSCYTGALLYKRINNTLFSKNPYPTKYFRPGILFRLGEFYLLYAEALNEVNPADARIIEYVDKIRERAGIPLLRTIKSGIIGNQELQRKAIHDESRVELCTEGQRYFDVRRWMVADKPTVEEGGQGGDFHGMDMNAGLDGFYKRTVFERRIFERRMFLYPLPLKEVQNSKLLIQNPGW